MDSGDFFRGGSRAQMTIFVVIAVVLFFGIVLFFLVQSDLLDSRAEKGEEVRSSLRDCLDFTTKSALYIVSYQGGYSRAPSKVFNFSPTFFPYYYHEGESYMPGLKDIEAQMGLFVKDNLGKCIDSVSSSGFDIEYDVRDVDVSIEKEGVRFVVDAPVVLESPDSVMEIELSSYPSFYEVPFLDMYEVSRFYVDDQLEDPEMYCISCITRMCEDSGLRFLIYPVFDNVDMVMVFEEGDDPLVLNFVNLYEEDVS